MVRCGGADWAGGRLCREGRETPRARDQGWQGQRMGVHLGERLLGLGHLMECSGKVGVGPEAEIVEGIQ